MGNIFCDRKKIGKSGFYRENQKKPPCTLPAKGSQDAILCGQNRSCQAKTSKFILVRHVFCQKKCLLPPHYRALAQITTQIAAFQAGRIRIFYIIDATRHFFLTISCIYWQFPVPYAGKLFTCQVKICKNSFLCFVFRQKALLSLLWPCSLGAPWPGAGKNNWQNGMAECLKVFERTQAPGRKGERPMPPGRRNRPQRNRATHTRSRRPGGCRHSCSGTLPPLQQCLFPVNPLESDFKGLHPEQIRDHAPGHKPDLWTRA